MYRYQYVFFVWVARRYSLVLVPRVACDAHVMGWASPHTTSQQHSMQMGVVFRFLQTLIYPASHLPPPLSLAWARQRSPKAPARGRELLLGHQVTKVSLKVCGVV
jgi:hypothetical protein